MKKIRESIRNKEILTLTLIVLLFFLIRFALVFIGTKLGETRENEQNQIKMNMLMSIVSEGNAKRTVADERITNHESADVRMITNFLKELVTEDGYTGPRVLPGGFVAELRDGRVILPEEYQALSSTVTLEMIEEGVEKGKVMGVALIPESAEENGAGSIEQHLLASPGFLTFEKISEDAVYISVMTESEYDTYLNNRSYNIYEALESADAAFGGITLAVQKQDNGLHLLWQIGMNNVDNALSAAVLTEKTIHEQPSTLTLDGQEYLCTFNELVTRSADGEDTILVQLLPLVSPREQNIKRALLVDLVMVVIFLAITVYVVSVQQYTTSHELTQEQAERYRPDRMRGRMINVGILSVLLTFSLALLIESVGQLYVELRYGRDTLHIVSKQLEAENQEWQNSFMEEEELWYAYYGKEMASLLSAYPELASTEKLQESCEALNLDYIMLFDSEGKLTNCSREFSGFTLTNEKNSELYDFRRLLYGMPGSISHDTSADGMTGLERHLIGVKIPAKSTGMHGALIMALMPEVVEGWASFNDETQISVAGGTACFAADSDTGEILYSSIASMVGKTIREFGLPESSLRDGYMDITAVSGESYLVVTSREGNWVYYFAVNAGTMFKPVLRFGLLVAVLFAVILALLLAFLLGNYNEKNYQESIKLYTQNLLRENGLNPGKTLSMIETKQARRRKSDLQEKQEENFLKKISGLLEWEQLQPKDKTIIVLRIGLVILVFYSLSVLQGKQLANESFSTMLGFLLHGEWMRGLNLFGLCSTLLVIATAYLINLLCILILKLTDKMSAKGGQTVHSLMYSCIKYATMFGVVYFSLGYLGFPNSTILASLGAVSLALSLGAQSLIADILAGLTIFFDRSFQVGDVVSINGTHGVVEEIGVRNTKLKVPVDNILIINHHKIGEIVNMSKRLSEYKLDIRLSVEQPLLPMEEMLNRELPSLGKKCSAIVEGPYLIGVTELAGPAFKLTIGAKIQEKDSYSVMLFLNQEIKLLFEREGISLF